MTYKLPERTHLIHKAVEPRNLGAKQRAVVEVESKDWLHQVKYDGCNVFFVLKDGEAVAFSRTGEPVLSMPHVGQELLRLNLGDCVVMGEAFIFGVEHSVINGAFRRQSPQPQLCLVLFDWVPLLDFEAGYCPVRYISRFTHIADALYVSKFKYALNSLWLAASGCEADIRELLEQRADIANDGLVAKNPEGEWIAGAGKGGEVLKVKNHLSLDLYCVGLVEGKGKFAGTLGALKVAYQGKVLTISCGTMTDADREHWWRRHCDDRGGLIGQIVEVHALAGSSKGLLREPRFHRLRTDKTEPSE